jgi:hypothetical protein
LELDYLFHEKVKARAFRTYPIDSEFLLHLLKSEEAEFSVSKLAQADEANLDRDVYDEKKNESQIEVSELPASNAPARQRSEL